MGIKCGGNCYNDVFCNTYQSPSSNAYFRDGTLKTNKDAVSIQLGSSKDVDVEVKDHEGKDISFNDINLAIALTPEQLLACYAKQMNNSRNLKSKVKSMVSKLSSKSDQYSSLRNSKSVPYISNVPGEENVVYIKDRLTVKDQVKGTEFDVEMDLRVEIEPHKLDTLRRSPKKTLKKTKSTPNIRSRSINDEDSSDDNGSGGCGTSMKQALSERFKRPLARRTRSASNDGRLFQKKKSDDCGSCISATWKRRLFRRQEKTTTTSTSEKLRSKSTDSPRKKLVQRTVSSPEKSSTLGTLQW